MEINPRFWASLELAIAAGVDFPDLGARMASEEKLDPVTDYKEGIRFRWLAQDILRLPEEPSGQEAHKQGRVYVLHVGQGIGTAVDAQP